MASSRSQRILARAPVRADPAGGGTDAPPFSVEHGGMVVNFALARHAFATVERLPAGSGVVVWSEDLREGVTASSANDLRADRLPLLGAIARRLVPEGESILLVTESDVPPGAGLGGSGALGVAAVAALDRAFGGARSPAEIAALANEIERVDLGSPGGNQDSFAAALGGINRLEYLVGGGTEPRRIDVPAEARRELEHRSLLIYTGEAHHSGNIHADIRASYALPRSPTVAAMVELRESARRMAIALEAGDLAAYARELDVSCDNLYRLHPSCDSEAHRELVEDLVDHIEGRKTCGAGGGGFLLVLARPGRRRDCRRIAEARGALVWPVVIDAGGVVTWNTDAPSGDDARRYREIIEP